MKQKNNYKQQRKLRVNLHQKNKTEINSRNINLLFICISCLGVYQKWGILCTQIS